MAIATFVGEPTDPYVTTHFNSPSTGMLNWTWARRQDGILHIAWYNRSMYERFVPREFMGQLATIYEVNDVALDKGKPCRVFFMGKPLEDVALDNTGEYKQYIETLFRATYT